jgi:hypothetical protein
MALAGYKSRHVSNHTHTSFLSFACAQQTKAKPKKCACNESTQIALFFAAFRSLVRGGWRRRDFVAPQAGSTAFGIRCSDSAKPS